MQNIGTFLRIAGKMGFKAQNFVSNVGNSGQGLKLAEMRDIGNSETSTHLYIEHSILPAHKAAHGPTAVPQTLGWRLSTAQALGGLRANVRVEYTKKDTKKK